MTPEEINALDALVKAATPAARWDRAWDTQPYARDGYPMATYAIGPQHGTPKGGGSDEDREAYDRAASARTADVALIHALVTAAPALIAAARDLAWHEDRHGTRAEQEAEDAALDADLARIDALSDEECKVEMAAEGIDYDAARKKIDVTIKLCAERAELKREVERLRAFVPVWRREDDHTLHLTLGPVALGGVMGPHPVTGAWGAMIMDEDAPTEHPDLSTAAAAVCARLGISSVEVPNAP